MIREAVLSALSASWVALGALGELLGSLGGLLGSGLAAQKWPWLERGSMIFEAPGRRP